MAEEDGLVISVRGEARAMVAPDVVVLGGEIGVWQGSKQDALTEAASALDRFTVDLSELGGAPLTVGTERSPLTWSAFSATTHAEREIDKQSGRHELTGRVYASVGIGVSVRDFGLLDTLGRVFARHERYNTRNVRWLVDDDNPSWSSVRTDAIQAARRKAQDYAAALGVSLRQVDHVADTGLLGGTGDDHTKFAGRRTAGAAAAGGRGGEDVETPSLDPVPQELGAVVEARFRATAAALSD